MDPPPSGGYAPRSAATGFAPALAAEQPLKRGPPAACQEPKADSSWAKGEPRAQPRAAHSKANHQSRRWRRAKGPRQLGNTPAHRSPTASALT